MCDSTLKIPTWKIFTNGLIAMSKDVSSLMRNWRGDWSWGRTCAVVALVKAWMLSNSATPNVPLVALWISVATASYGTNKVTEMVCARTTVQSGDNQ
jgi:hypothetical protein